MKQQTAVEWLWRWQMDNEFASFKEALNAYNQAKAMEKEQIEKGYFKGHCDGYNAGVNVYEQVEFQSAEKYYNETYNK